MNLLKKLIILQTSVLIACIPQKDKQLSLVLDCAQENRQELEKVLRYYNNDPEKLAAARFLILNMPYHYTLEQYYVSPQNEKLKPDITAFDSLQCAAKLFDSFK